MLTFDLYLYNLSSVDVSNLCMYLCMHSDGVMNTKLTAINFNIIMIKRLRWRFDEWVKASTWIHSLCSLIAIILPMTIHLWIWIKYNIWLVTVSIIDSILYINKSNICLESFGKLKSRSQTVNLIENNNGSRMKTNLN